MKIEQDQVVRKRDKSSANKTMTLIAISIVIVILIVIGIVMVMANIKEAQLAITVDGKRQEFTEDTFIFMETGEIYVSIRDIAPLVGYETHNGEYKVNTEDTTKMYVEAKDGTETTSFYLNSTLINKIAPESTEDYEAIEITSPVTMINDKWYIQSDGFMQAFNSVFYYNKETNKITIQTLPYLTSYYENNISSFGYDKLSEEFNNQKALIYGMIVASKSSTEKYGVINSRTGEEIIGPRYNKIEFIESSREFIITNSSEKVGITYSTGETKINVNYDDIKVFNSSLGYYLVESNSKYGIINSNEELVIHIEYDDIGIESLNFQSDNLKSQYMLYDNFIPVCLNNKWGLFDKEGNKITEVEYDNIGCIIDKEMTERVVNNVITVGDTGVVIVSKDGVYGGVNEKSDLLIPLMFDYVYSITSGGETKYYIVYNGVDYSATDYIDRMKEVLGYEEENNNSEGSVNNDQDNNNEEENNQNKGNSGENEEPNSTAVQLFNAGFETFEGEHSGSTVRELIKKIDSSNLSSSNQVKLEYNGKVYLDDISKLNDIIDRAKNYTITMEYNESTKYVEKIIVK